tara:strand:- start:2503 stop:3618 length:1116 start_codon:yes stop_codon:yes gene_type:complete
MIKLTDILTEQATSTINKSDRVIVQKNKKPKRMRKKKQTQGYLDQIQNTLEPDQFNRFMQVYDLAGRPDMIDPNQARGLVNKNLQKNINKGGGVAAYNALQGDIIGFSPLRDNDVDQTLHAALAELPHALQWRKHKGKIRNIPHALGSFAKYTYKDLIKPKFTKKDPYKTKGAYEYHAHEEMENVIRDYIMQGDPSGEIPKRVTDLKGQKPKEFEWDTDRFEVKHDHVHEGIIRLRDLLIESISKREIMDVVNKVYPHIVKDLGGKKLPVVVHNNIYRRLKAVGEEDLMKQNNPFAQYDWDTKKIYLYSSAMKNIEEIIRSLLHEHTHSLQDKKKFDAGYDSGKYNYKTHPYEKAANRAEKKWKNYLKFVK